MSFTINDENTDSNGDWYFIATLTARPNNSKSERYTSCYFDYELEDGTTGSTSFYVRQLSDNGVNIRATNPKEFDANSLTAVSLQVNYTGINALEDIEDVYVYPPSLFVGEATSQAMADDDTGYVIYSIKPVTLNVGATDVEGTAKFAYYNQSNSATYYNMLYLVQRGCKYPFILTKGDGSAIPEEKYMANPAYKRWRDISFRANSVQLRCHLPFADTSKGQIKVELKCVNADDFATISTSAKAMLDYAGVTHTYTVNFKENYETYQRRADVTVTYYTSDGIAHTDTAQLYQNPTDGSNLTSVEVKTNVSKMSFYYDGTPSLYDHLDVTWVGDFNTKTVESNDSWIHIGSPTLVEDNGNYNKKYRYPITVDENTDTENVRTGEIVAYGMGWDYSDASVRIEITQSKAPIFEPVIKPTRPSGDNQNYIGQIWQDVEYDFGYFDVVEYNIFKKTDNGEDLIFTGRSCRRPGAEKNSILVNKICQNYIEVPLLKEGETFTGGFNTFVLKDKNNSFTYKTFHFINDWSYSNEFYTGLLSHPILNNNTVYAGQYLPFSVFSDEYFEVEYSIKYKSGYEDEWGEIKNDSKGTTTVDGKVKTVCFPSTSELQYANGVNYYQIGDYKYPVKNCGVDYVLYYLNPWGGFDWFPILGKVVETDDLTQHTYTQNYNNTTWEFGKRRYLSEIKKKYQLNTHWLKEDESSRMWYLIQSNTVYLHNIKTGKVYPVNITNTSQEHKKRSITSSRISYQIEVELSQTRERL